MDDQPDLIEGLCDKITTRFYSSEVLFHAKIPVTKHAIKKNNREIHLNRKTGRRFIGKSQDLHRAEDYLTLSFKSRGNELGIKGPILGPVWVIMLFYYSANTFYTKEGEPSKLRGDLSNLYQIVEDCLQEAQIIQDDTQICSHDLSRRLPSDKMALEVFILRHQFDFRPAEESIV